MRLAVFDPCHLRHAQGVVDEPRRLAAQVASEVLELRDAGRCCGAASLRSRSAIQSAA
jgi:glycolate oxidase iron-sulfur subunit